jgi:serine/threonine protein kinase/TolB-like protein/Tfp pilus assembly protein PilF
VTPDRWNQVKTILEAVLGQPTGERVAFLAGACGGDDALRAEVESLLASDERASRFMPTAALQDALQRLPEAPTRVLTGVRVGAYRIVSEIARGGMGAVYLAEREDGEYHKQVAIKLVKDGGDSESVVRRFRQERQILAELEHPNIARLLDGGRTDDGLPYFVMEHVEGMPIDAYCEAGNLSVAQRLDLFRTVCSAVGHAHAKLVVHRDLKPSNILVSSGGTPKLLDFGIAKLLNPAPGSERTVTGARLMTPDYASPEQICGAAVTPASDIYSLGVVLYRLLAGRGPYRVTSDLPHELVRAICEEDPRPPSAWASPTVRKELAGDLDAIVLKALRKEPPSRYASVEELSEDIGRYREGRPVTARTGGLAYRWRRFIGRNRAATLMAAAMVASATLSSAVLYQWSRARSTLPARPGPITSLAVLPLVNLSQDPEQEYFADGMTDALITDLSRIGSLRVVSRTSVMPFKGTNKLLPEIARELNVDGVVEGSVLRSGDHVRITVQLIRAADDRHLWAKSYERELRDILALQGGAAQAIAGEIKGKLTVQEQAQLTNRPPVSPDAYLACVRGRYFWNRRNEDSLKTAIAHFEEALKQEPAYAPAYSGLADSYFYRGYAFGRLPPREAMPKARAAALKALELDDTLADAHTSLALVRFFYDWDWSGAEREFQRAIELNPNYATAHHGYAVFLATMHRWDDSVAEARRALEVDPLSLPVNNILGEMLRRSGRFDEAIDQYQKTLELDPSFAMAHNNLGAAYESKGIEKQAVEQFLKGKALSGESATNVEELRGSYERGGMHSFRRKELELARAGWNGWHWADVTIASLYAYLGQRDEAMQWLEKAYAARSGALMWIDMDSTDGGKGLRSDPRFQELLRRIGLPSQPPTPILPTAARND